MKYRKLDNMGISDRHTIWYALFFYDLWTDASVNFFSIFFAGGIYRLGTSTFRMEI